MTALAGNAERISRLAGTLTLLGIVAFASPLSAQAPVAPPVQSNSGIDPYIVPPTSPPPAATMRPENWPAGALQHPGAVPASFAPPQNAVNRQVAPQAFMIDGAKVMARVGNEAILASDIVPDVNELIAKNGHLIPPSQLDEVRAELIRDRLQQAVEMKLIVAHAYRKVPEANLGKIVDTIGNEFDRNRVNSMIKDAKVESRAELDAKLRQTGSSVDRKRRAFIDQSLASAWIGQQVKGDDKEITYQQLVEYYREHAADYEFPNKARWEQLTARFADFPNRDAAKGAIAQMGNQVIGGAPLSSVAKASSGGPTAAAGGQYDWTSQGSLASKTLDDALFALPIGQLSPILEDDRGYHIVRVLERKSAGRTPFTEVQPEIKKKIEAERDEAGKSKGREFIDKLKKETPVWTVFDGKKPADEAAPLKPGSPMSVYGAPAGMNASTPNSPAGSRYRR